MARVKERQNKKLNGSTVEKNIQDGLQYNPNNWISNLTGKTLLDTENKILRYSLKDGYATRPSELGNDPNS